MLEDVNLSDAREIWSHPDGHIGVVPIHKVASTSITLLVRGAGWIPFTNEYPPCPLVAFLRHPVDRYMSAASMTLNVRPYDEVVERMRTEPLYTNDGDLHFAPQTLYLSGREKLLPLSYADRWFRPFGKLQPLRRTENSGDFWESVLDSNLRERIMSAYSTDLALWKSLWGS